MSERPHRGQPGHSPSAVGSRNELRELSGGYPKDERFASYHLLGPELDPDEVTRLTGVSPDRSWRKGDPKPRTGRPYSHGAWRIKSGLGPSDEFHDHLDALLDRLRPSWATFVELGQRYEAGIDAAIYLHDAQGPLIAVLPEVAASLSELGVTLGFDLYALLDEDESGSDK